MRILYPAASNFDYFAHTNKNILKPNKQKQKQKQQAKTNNKKPRQKNKKQKQKQNKTKVPTPKRRQNVKTVTNIFAPKYTV